MAARRSVRHDRRVAGTASADAGARTMQEKRIVVDGVGLAVRESGPRDAIVFLHYGGGNLMMWEPVVPFFETAHRCVRLDLRGHGRSDAPPSGYRLEDMAHDVAGVLDALKVDAAHVV